MTERRESAAELTGRLLNIINTSDVLRAYRQAHPREPRPVAIMYRSQQTGRAYQCAAWQVYAGMNVKTDDGPKPYWRDRGLKTFNVFYVARQKLPQLEAAKAWASERYGVTEWKKLRYVRAGAGDWLPAAVIDWYEAQRKVAIKRDRDTTRAITAAEAQS